jgi:branched-chain amino acid transport system ATP-binding protein
VSSQALLSVQHLTFAFGRTLAIDDVSFSAREGEMTALAGPRGAGKTTVLNCITGFCRPLKGRIELRSRAPVPFLLERMDPCRVVRQARVARAFRNPRVFAGMTVLENVLVAQNTFACVTDFLSAMIALPRKRARKAAERAHYWLDRLGLGHAPARMAGDLAPGLQRRLEIARALATEPRLICIDQPETGLIDRERDELAELLFGLKADGPAILLTIEDLRMAMLCDHVIVLERGTCIGAGTPRAICGSSTVVRAWLGTPPGGEAVPRLAVSC